MVARNIAPYLTAKRWYAASSRTMPCLMLSISFFAFVAFSLSSVFDLGGRGGFRFRLILLLEVLEEANAFGLIDGRHNVAREVDDFLDFRSGEAEHERDTARNAAEEPDVRDRSREIDVSHALAANDGAGYFYAALFADDTAEANAAVFAAVTFIVFLGTEDALVEEASSSPDAACGS